ncbi:alginate lyase family protein [Myroides odoratimimus]|nr:alginate lyase family protein [Myroides odoratimimus]
MGSRYILYRASHEFEKKTGLLKKRHPSSFYRFSPISLSKWREYDTGFLINKKETHSLDKNVDSNLKENAERILQGDILFFSAEWINLGVNYNWITNPVTNYTYNISKHWSEVPDLLEEAGDIKYVWEKSRFSYLFTLIRYDYHFDKDLSERVFSDIESWIDANPINCGPNWRCSQEISLRILNWYYVLQYYKNSTALTENRWNKIQQVIYASLHHVYHHIDFSRIAVRNNHAITETLLLTLSNILFPFIPETEKWSIKGKKWFEKEIAYQVYDDGTFLQFSMNYHRVVVQLLTLGISIYHRYGKKFDRIVYDRAYKSVNFLYQCMQDENGKLPNYGSNDGAWFFPLSNSDYRDYRPQLNALHYTLTGVDLDESFDKEESHWFSRIHIDNVRDKISKRDGVMSFDIGGYYLCRQGDTFTFIRCGNHKDRPAQADNLHIDIWNKGNNILRDSGSYKYNTTKDKLDYFMGTLSHNTVMVDNKSQMLKGSRFIWYYWTQKRTAFWEDKEEYFEFKGVVSAYRYLNSGATHYRRIQIYKDVNKWIVNDSISNLNGREKRQIWHVNSDILAISSNRKLELFDSFNSDYYGVYEKTQSSSFAFEKEIETILELKI